MIDILPSPVFLSSWKSKVNVFPEREEATIDSSPLETKENEIFVLSLSTSLMTLLKSITVLSASSLTVTSLGAFATVGASSVFGTVIVTETISLVKEPGSVTVKL